MGVSLFDSRKESPYNDHKKEANVAPNHLDRVGNVEEGEISGKNVR